MHKENLVLHFIVLTKWKTSCQKIWRICYFHPFNHEPFIYYFILCFCGNSKRLFTNTKYYFLKFWKRKQWRFPFESPVSIYSRLNDMNENKLEFLCLNNEQNVLHKFNCVLMNQIVFNLLEMIKKTCVESWLFSFQWR